MLLHYRAVITLSGVSIALLGTHYINRRVIHHWPFDHSDKKPLSHSFDCGLPSSHGIPAIPAGQKHLALSFIS